MGSNWPLTKDNSWLANKGAGAWPFTEQPEKLGYINNPYFTDAPGDPNLHEPCGYWKKGASPQQGKYNIVVSLYYKGLVAARYDGNALSYVGGSGDINGQFGNVLYSSALGAYVHAKGVAGSRQIVTRSTTAPFTVLNTYTPFLSSDLDGTGKMVLHYNPDLDKFVCTSSGSVHAIQVNGAFAREAKWYLGTVTTGTDGNLYYGHHAYNRNGSWDDVFRPITGGQWTFRWSLVPGNVHDGSVATWAVGNYYAAVGSYGYPSNLVYGENAYFVTTPENGAFDSGGLYKFASASHALDPLSIQHIPNTVSSGYGAQLVRNGRVYISVPDYTAGNLAVQAYSTTTLQLLATSPTDATGIIGNRVLAAGSAGLYEFHYDGTSAWRVRLLEYSTLQELAAVSVTLPTGAIVRNIIEYNASKLIVVADSGGDGYVRVIDFPGGTTQADLKFSDYMFWGTGDTVINALFHQI